MGNCVGGSGEWSLCFLVNYVRFYPFAGFTSLSPIPQPPLAIFNSFSHFDFPSNIKRKSAPTKYPPILCRLFVSNGEKMYETLSNIFIACKKRFHFQRFKSFRFDFIILAWSLRCSEWNSLEMVFSVASSIHVLHNHSKFGHLPLTYALCILHTCRVLVRGQITHYANNFCSINFEKLAAFRFAYFDDNKTMEQMNQ